MRRTRIAVAVAAALTALLLQATIVAPVTFPWAVSLPAVLVAAVALTDGAATGMSFGFSIGLLADLGSHHPAGVLALCWLGVGIVAGSVADRRTVRRDAVVVGVVGGVGAAVSTVLLAIVHAGGSLHDALVYLPVTALGDGVLALAVVPVVRRMLATDTLRRPAPVFTDLAVETRRG